jgi:hypothetical protein
MVRSTRLLADFEARYAREGYRGLTYDAALGLYAALWAEACQLNRHIGEDWQDDLAPDLAIARAVNGLPPAAP